MEPETPPRFTVRALVEVKTFRVKKEEKRAPVARKLEVSLDRADNIIEGGPPAAPVDFLMRKL